MSEMKLADPVVLSGGPDGGVYIEGRGWVPGVERNIGSWRYRRVSEEPRQAVYCGTASPALKATLRLGPGGRVVIPADMREAMGLKQGDAMLARLEGSELNLVTFAETVRQLQTLTRKYVPEGVSLAVELIADRRAEAAREERD